IRAGEWNTSPVPEQRLCPQKAACAGQCRYEKRAAARNDPLQRQGQRRRDTRRKPGEYAFGRVQLIKPDRAAGGDAKDPVRLRLDREREGSSRGDTQQDDQWKGHPRRRAKDATADQTVHRERHSARRDSDENTLVEAAPPQRDRRELTNCRANRRLTAASTMLVSGHANVATRGAIEPSIGGKVPCDGNRRGQDQSTYREPCEPDEIRIPAP